MDPTLLAKGLPSWAIQYALVILLWFGVNYFALAPLMYDRATLPLRAQISEQLSKHDAYFALNEISSRDVNKYLDCMYGRFFYENRMDVTVWTSSMGFIETSLSREFMQVSLDTYIGENICGKIPWERSDV